jgi:hypothetical protein
LREALVRSERREFWRSWVKLEVRLGCDGRREFEWVAGCVKEILFGSCWETVKLLVVSRKLRLLRLIDYSRQFR